MCIYTKYILNPKYLPSKRNGYNPPPLLDERLKYVPTKCGKCIECRKQRQREWIVRLSEELKEDNQCLFVTLTINDYYLDKLKEKDWETDNDIATKAVRRFLERIRKEKGKSIRHWFVTELGEDNGRIHLHGITWCSKETVEKHWKYGFIYIGDFVNEKTIFYITKYMLKINEIDKNFIGKVLCSKGIGAGYIKSLNAKRNRYKENDTKESYKLRNGIEIALPQYYRNKLYNEEEKEKMWIEKQESGYRYLMGEKVSTENEQEYNQLLEYYQEQGKRLWGDNVEEWDKQRHINTLRKMRKARQKAVEKLKKSVNK